MPLAIRSVAGEGRVDSRDVAKRMDVRHKNTLGLIEDYLADFQHLGPLAFETEVRPGAGRGGLPARFALLNEEHCYFLLSLSRNSDTTVAMKRELVLAFAAFRRLAQEPPALPAPSGGTGIDFLRQLAGNMLLALDEKAAEVKTELRAELDHRLGEQPVRVNSQMRARLHAAGHAFGKVHPRSYRGAWLAFKEAFGYAGAPLAAYDDLPVWRFDEAMTWLEVQTRTFSAQTLLDGDPP